MRDIRRYWWTVWIKVAVLAVALLLAYNYASDKIEEMISPYILEETASVEASSEKENEEEEEEEGNLLTKLLGKVERVLGVELDYENMIFDYATEYTQTIKEESKADRDVNTEKLS